MKRIDKQCWSWAFYDWANSAFATTVLAGFFPLFFKKFWSADASATLSTFYLGSTNAVVSLLVAVLAPILGTLADQTSNRKTYLLSFASLGIFGTACFYYIPYGQWQIAVAAMMIASIGFAGANIFNDALLPHITDDENVNFLSGFGFALGYLGGGLLFAVNVMMVLYPQMFYLPDKIAAVQTSFLTVALWWFIFSIPLLLWVHEKSFSTVKKNILSSSFKQLKNTFLKIRSQKSIFLFLLAYFFFIDGVHTIIKMAVDYGLSIGLEQNSLITALLITQFVGFPATILMGYLGQRWNAKYVIYFCLTAYLIITICGYFMQNATHFYMVAIAIGMVQGGIQSQSRSLYAQLIPSSNESGEYFGFYNMLGKFSAVIGPFMVGWISLTTGNSRLGVLSIATLFILGMVILRFVPNNKK